MGTTKKQHFRFEKLSNSAWGSLDSLTNQFSQISNHILKSSLPHYQGTNLQDLYPISPVSSNYAAQGAHEEPRWRHWSWWAWHLSWNVSKFKSFQWFEDVLNMNDFWFGTNEYIIDCWRDSIFETQSWRNLILLYDILHFVNIEHCAWAMRPGPNAPPVNVGGTQSSIDWKLGLLFLDASKQVEH